MKNIASASYELSVVIFFCLSMTSIALLLNGCQLLKEGWR